MSSFFHEVHQALESCSTAYKAVASPSTLANLIATLSGFVLIVSLIDKGNILHTLKDRALSMHGFGDQLHTIMLGCVFAAISVSIRRIEGQEWIEHSWFRLTV